MQDEYFLFTSVCGCFVQCEWFFSSWDEDVYVPVDEEADEAAPISSMNREMLAKAESLGMYIRLYTCTSGRLVKGTGIAIDEELA